MQEDNPLCGRGTSAADGPYMHELDGNVEEMYGYWLPVMCRRVETALKAKFRSPAATVWHGTNGLGLPITGTTFHWKEKNGDMISENAAREVIGNRIKGLLK